MPKLLQINITANWGSHGRIAEGIAQQAISQGWESHIAYGRWANASQSQLFRIGSMADEYLHVAATRLTDSHGLHSRRATRKLISYIHALRPDVIHLHNIHGYYLNYPLLFQFLSGAGIPVVWTLHDCWSFTGHCAHFMTVGCKRWMTECHHCPLKRAYPQSFLLDASARNYQRKRKAFLSVTRTVIVTVSQWLDDVVSESFLNALPRRLIYNGIDMSRFCILPDGKGVLRKYGIPTDRHIVLGVASKWYRQKGIDDFFRLRRMLADDFSVVLVGLDKKQAKALPAGIIGVQRTDDVGELARLYSEASVFFNPTWEDNFPTTNIEALACGTPVVTYRTGGCPEAINDRNGCVVEQGDIEAAVAAVKRLCNADRDSVRQECRQSVVHRFDQQERFKEYIDLYRRILSPEYCASGAVLTSSTLRL